MLSATPVWCRIILTKENVAGKQLLQLIFQAFQHITHKCEKFACVQAISENIVIQTDL